MSGQSRSVDIQASKDDASIRSVRPRQSPRAIPHQGMVAFTGRPGRINLQDMTNGGDVPCGCRLGVHDLSGVLSAADRARKVC